MIAIAMEKVFSVEMPTRVLQYCVNKVFRRRESHYRSYSALVNDGTKI